MATDEKNPVLEVQRAFPCKVSSLDPQEGDNRLGIGLRGFFRYGLLRGGRCN
jgi:hypothetical protein